MPLLTLNLTALQETNPSPPQPDEDGAEETGQEIVSPDAYMKHPLQNRLESAIESVFEAVSLIKDGIQTHMFDLRFEFL